MLHFYECSDMRKLTSKKERGVHLLECILSTCLSVLLISISLPSIREIQKRAQVRFVADKITAHLQRAHSLALGNHLQTSVSVRLLEESFREVEINSGKKEFFFYISGATSPGTLTIRDNTYMCRITLSLRGRIRRVCQNE